MNSFFFFMIHEATQYTRYYCYKRTQGRYGGIEKKITFTNDIVN